VTWHRPKTVGCTCVSGLARGCDDGRAGLVASHWSVWSCPDSHCLAVSRFGSAWDRFAWAFGNDAFHMEALDMEYLFRKMLEYVHDL